jgi:hypothetical protein
MKCLFILLLALLPTGITVAQQTIAIRNLWTRPQVHVQFNGYTLSFSVKDIDKTLGLLRAMGDSSHYAHCGLDTAKNYYCELYPGNHTQYRDEVQPLMQNVVGCFLLSAGHAVVQNKKHKLLKEIIVDIEPLEIGDILTLVTVYDPETKTIIFQGKMHPDLYRKDLGIDD